MQISRQRTPFGKAVSISGTPAAKIRAKWLAKYGTALEAAGWRIDDIGGGGDPFGLFGGGAGLTATNADRYLKGPCRWPGRCNLHGHLCMAIRTEQQ